MHQNITTIKRALLSVSNKAGIVKFARELAALNIEILSTGGTSQLLREANIPVRDVSDVTLFPEIMDGRVKTLHPKVHGGILGLRDEHAEVAKQHDINWIDLVVVNLYPFADTIKKPNVSFDEAVENIDIGGPTMIRSAAKNMGWVGVVVDANDYDNVLTELKTKKGLCFETRRALATKAFTHTAEYDALISQYCHTVVMPANHNVMPAQAGIQKDPHGIQQSHHAIDNCPHTSEGWHPGRLNSSWHLENTLTLNLKKSTDLRYGENPQQSASAYIFPGASGILTAKQYQGKELSYNNIADADAAVACVREFSEPACVIVKHANPCGVAIADTIEQAFENAFNADSVSAFGGIVALNQPCTKEVAEKIAQIFFEVLVAPAYSPAALEILAKKPNLRVLALDYSQLNMQQEIKFVEGGLLIQDKDKGIIKESDLKIVTVRQPSSSEIESLLFAWQVVKHIKSNAILIAKNNVTVGIGAGQVSRIDAVDLAIKKAGQNLMGTVLASDAFFPFRDSIDRLANTGIKAVIQPGGSVRDEEVIAACNEYGIAMVLTGSRCFKH